MGASSTRHTIGIEHVRRLLLGASRRGLRPEGLVQQAGISPTLLASPLARVTQDQFAALILVLRHRLRDELWGLCSEPLPIGSFAQVAQLTVRCATLGEALDLGLRQLRLLLRDFVPRLQRRHGEVAMSLVPSRPDLPSTPELAFAQRSFAFFAYGYASWLVARRVPLLAVDYPRQDPRIIQAAMALFGAPVRTGTGRVGWLFEPQWLDLPVVQTRQTLRDFLRQAPDSLLVPYRDQGTLTERMRRLLRGRLHGELPSLQQVGRELAMSPQILRRRLNAEGQSFQALKDNLRRDAAIEFLGRAELNLMDIAERLGFSEASTFNRAFKKWTGVSPGVYRSRRQHAHDYPAEAPDRARPERSRQSDESSGH